jgi:hypothetical protein
MDAKLIDSSMLEESNEVTVSLVSMTIDDEDLVSVDLDSMALITESTIIL